MTNNQTIALGLIPILVGGALFRNELPAVTPYDVIALVLVCALLWWCLGGDRPRALNDASGHQETRESFPLRLGKALKRIRRGR